MATVAKLVEALAQTLIVPGSEVHHMARRLREAGLLPAEGRGRGAPSVTPDDAARLLIVVLAADIATRAPEAVRAVDQEGPAVHGVFIKKSLVVAPAGTFVQAVAHIIERLANPASQGQWYNTVRCVGVRRTGDSRPSGWIEVVGGHRTTYGSHITLHAYAAHPEVGAVGTSDGHIGEPRRPTEPKILPGLTQERLVGVRELFCMARLFEGR